MRLKGKNPIAFIYYFFAFLLLSEWFSPLQKFTDTGNTYIFIIFIGISFLLTFFRVKWFITFPVKLIVISYFLYELYYKDLLNGDTWASKLATDFIHNMNLIRHAMWDEMDSPFRTMLFFILLWLLVYLIHYWIVYQRRIFFFFIITVIYITVLDTFMSYDASFAIIRIVLIGFFMVGLLTFERIKDVEGLKVSSFTGFRWILPLLFFITGSILIGVLAPKVEPQWPDPVPYFKAYGQALGDKNNMGVRKIGYGTNDEKLGGAFVEDNTEVFNHFSKESQYWRVETKDVYTGKGWRLSNPNAKEIPLNDMEWTDDHVEKKELSSIVQIDKRYPYRHIIYPFHLTNIYSNSTVSYYINPITELITARNGEVEQQVSEYQVDYEVPEYNVDKLEKVIPSENNKNALFERYTQLPDSLPDRVKKLAVQITVDKNNQFSKVKAIERYLNSPEFKYETKNVPIPKDKEDYVDQFLFETMRGYCDNFSTAMIVLLRSIDIPARWVKGYTEGEYQESYKDNVKRYTVTNNNAHSWVEVYFEGIGWVTFEPTKGFSNPYRFTYNSGRTDTIKKDKTIEKKESVEKQETVNKKENKDFSIRFGNFLIYLFIVLVCIVVFIAYKTRRIWLAKIIILRYKKRRDDEVFFQAYNALLKQLERLGLKRPEGQTLREYADVIDGHFSNQDMAKLTSHYEKILYRRSDVKEEWERSVELWENIMKRTAS